MTRPSDIEMLSDLAGDEPPKAENLSKGIQKFLALTRAGSQQGGLRKGFYSQKNRPAPSLPRLKFLEKD